MPTDDFITCDFPDLDAFIKELDLMDARVNAAFRAGLNAGADIIRDSQRRLILSKPPAPSKPDGKKHRRISKGSLSKLAKAIDKSEIFVTKRGTLGVRVGYQDDAFKTDGDGFNAGVVGLTFEFGRPGQSSSARRSETMTQTRHGKRYKVRKGAIQAVPHIRMGFDVSVNRASQAVINAYNAAMDKL